MKRFAIIGATVAALAVTATVPAQAQDQILNASYDIARELFVAINAAFVPAYETETGVSVTVDQSHGGRRARHAPLQKAWKPTSSPSTR